MPKRLACATDRTKLLVKSPCETAQKSWFWTPPSPPVNWHLHMCYSWPVRNTIVTLPIRLKGKSKHIGIGSPGYWHGFANVTNWQQIMSATQATLITRLTVQDLNIYFVYKFKSNLIFKSSKIHKIYFSGAPNENTVQNHLNIALLNAFQYFNGRYRHIFIP